MIEYLLLASGGHWWGPGQSAPSPASCLPASVRPQATPPGAGVSAMGPQPVLSPHTLSRGPKLWGSPSWGSAGPHREEQGPSGEPSGRVPPATRGLKVTSKVWPGSSLCTRVACVPGKAWSCVTHADTPCTPPGLEGPRVSRCLGRWSEAAGTGGLRPTVPPGVRGRPHLSRPPASSLFLPDPARGQARKSRPPPRRLGEVP